MTRLTGIIERLKAASEGDGYWPPILADQAAEELERLSKKLASLTGVLQIAEDEGSGLSSLEIKLIREDLEL